MLEPDTAAMLAAAARAAAETPSARSISELPLDEARAGYATRYRARGLPSAPGVRERAIELRLPGRTLAAHLFLPEGEAAPPLLIYFHGGGYVVGGGNAYAAQSSALAASARVAVLVPDYRLAPEHPFPAAVDDAVAVLRFAREDDALPGTDTARLVLGGDSAGGALALVAALQHPEVPLGGLALAYPWVDARPYLGGADWPSITAFGRGYWLDTTTMRWFAEAVWPDAAVAEDPRASPILARSFAGLPPTRITVSDHDPLHDQVMALAGRMLADGTEVRVRLERGLVHNFLGHGAVSKAARDAFACYAADVAALANSPG